MAAYPSIDQSYDSVFTPIDSTKIDIAADGTVRGRSEYSDTQYNATLIHPYIDSTDKDSILSHYASDKNNTFSVTRDANSTAYTMVYLGEPEVVKHNATYWTVVTKLVGSET